MGLVTSMLNELVARYRRNESKSVRSAWQQTPKRLTGCIWGLIRSNATKIENDRNFTVNPRSGEALVRKEHPIEPPQLCTSEITFAILKARIVPL